MKKILSIIITLSIVFSSFGVIGIAAESDHWAYSMIGGLLNDGTVSGDQSGNLNLDNYITRAEFVKTINRYFNLTEKSLSGFSDVSENKWYYDEMLIAKKAGYIKGDENGFANPEFNITRAEVSVIIARLLGLSDNLNYNFTDLNEIPDWAKGSVGALYSKGIIKGYHDNTFKAGSSITRAEAFVIVSRNDKNDYKENYEQEVSQAAGTYIPSGTSSGGGSSYGGGGSSGGGIIIPPASGTATISPRYFDDIAYSVEFTSTNATGYSIKFNVNGDDYPEQALILTNESGDYKYASFTSLVPTLLTQVGINGFNADVYIEAKGSVNSGYVKFGTVYLEYDIDNVENVVLTYNTSNDKYDLIWNPVSEAEGYKVILYSDKDFETKVSEFETSETFYTVDSGTLALFTTCYVTVVAKKQGVYANPKTIAGSIVNGFGGGDGTDENPYLIYNTSHLNNVKLKNGCSFKQMADIGSEGSPVTTSITEENTEFTGKYDGNNYNLYVNLASQTAISDNTLQGFGLFPKANGATIKNVILNGAVNGKGNVGGIVGWATGKCSLYNNINKAKITASAYYAAGIAGRIYDGDSISITIENCINYGEVKSSGVAAGIAGVSGYANTVTGCGNYGYVWSSNTLGSAKAAGIVADAYGQISNSYNFGMVKCTSAKPGMAGGIATVVNSANLTFENCFNAGEISAATYIAAIVNSSTSNDGADRIPTIKNCYNLNKNINLSQGTCESVYTNCYTINEADAKEGITYKTASELTELNISNGFTRFNENILNEDYNHTFRYPQIKGNLLPKDYSYNDENFVMEIKDISYDESVDKWYVTISPTVKGIAKKYVLDFGVFTQDITKFNDSNKYEITSIPDINTPVTLYAYNGSTKIDKSASYNGVFAASVTDTSVNAKDMSISFKSQNATAYKIKFVISGKDDKIYDLAVTNGANDVKTASYAELEDELISYAGQPSFNTDVYVSAVGKTGYKDSGFVKFATVLIGEAIADVNGLNAVYNKATDKYDVSWSAVDNAAGYKVYTYSDEGLTTNISEEEIGNVLTYSLDATDTVYSFGTKYYVTVVAKVGSSFGTVNSSNKVSFVSGFAGGSGTDADPYVIASYNQFEKVFKNGSTADKTKTYLLTGFDETAMELPSDYKPLGVAFTGKLIGGNMVGGNVENKVQKINFNITTGNATAGVDYFTEGSNKVQGIIFHKLQGATVKNLEFTGNVNTPNTPSFFGTLAGYSNGSIIDNIHNKALVESYQQKGTGGIIGWTGGNGTITKCTNRGNITVPHDTTARADVGGIVGNMTATTITDCYNYADIQGRDNAGGIAGYSNCNISKCGNYGNISVTRTNTYGYAAGISGRGNGGNISECFNAGNIKSVKYAAGIISNVPSGKTTNITNCFNIGVISGTTGSGLAIGLLQGTSTVKGFYDLKNPSVMSLAASKTGTLNVQSAYSFSTTVTDVANDVDKVESDTIKSLTTSTDTAFTDTAIWEIKTGYSYPNLKNNPYSGSDIVIE